MSRDPSEGVTGRAGRATNCSFYYVFTVIAFLPRRYLGFDCAFRDRQRRGEGVFGWLMIDYSCRIIKSCSTRPKGCKLQRA